MNGASGQYERAVELFERCLALSAPDRAKVLDAECADDAGLRTTVEGMLRADAEPGAPMLHDLLDRALDSVRDTAPPPDSIGPYRVVREIGRGGMGVVYEAVHPRTGQHVAVKVLSAFGSGTLAKRLRREATILSSLAHPGIAKILETGTAEYRGEITPYLAMELIDGIPVDEFVRSNRLSDSAKLELIARIADAVHAAHELGVIHRDLKPANILVTRGAEGPGEPRVLDFGVAMVQNDRLDATTLRTETGLLIGTLNYMSPEQIDARSPVDARTDVFALGVLAFELLSGARPADLDGLSLVQALARLRDATQPTLTIGGELAPRAISNIVAMAMAREPGRRYDSAAALASDIRGYLSGTALQAKPPSAAYQVREFARRNRVFVSVAVALFLALSVGLASSTWFALSLARSERRADWMSYRAFIAASSAAVDQADADRALNYLADCPAEHRGWEWHHLMLSARPGQPAFGGATLTGLSVDVESGAYLGVSEGRLVRWRSGEEAGTRLGEFSQALNINPTIRSGKGVLVQSDGRVVLFDAESGEQLDEVPRTFEPARDVRLSLTETGGVVCISATDGLFVWDFERKRFVFDQDLLRPGPMPDACVSPDGRWLVYCVTGAVTVTVIHDLVTGESEVLRGSRGSRRVAITPDSRLLVVGTNQRSINVFDLATRENVRTLQGHSGSALALYCPSPDVLLSIFNDETCKVWELSTGRLLNAFPVPMSAALVATSEDVVSRGRDGLASHLLTHGSTPVLKHPTHVYALGWSPDGTLLASTAFRNGGTVLWNTSTLEPIARLETEGRTLAVTQFTPNGAGLIVSSQQRGGTNKVWAGPDWTGPGVTMTDAEIAEVRGSVRGLTLSRVRYSPDARYRLERASGTRWLARNDARTVAELSHPETVRAIAWSPDSRTLVTGTQPGDARVWRTPGFEPIAVLTHESGLWDAAFSPDGTRLATAGDDGIVRIYDTVHWELLLELSGHSTYVHAVEFSPDGSRLASGSGDGTIRIWAAAQVQ